MKFSDLDAKMRVYEKSHDLCVLPGLFIVARIDGRSFTRLTKEQHDFTRPFDPRFRDMMVNTVTHLMRDAGFRVAYGYTQSDEISLLFHTEEESFGRKIRKWNSVLAGEASASFALQLGSHAAFDCRLIQLPSSTLVVDYFRWRAADASRNALNAYCYWLLRDQGYNARQASKRLEGATISDKNELLFASGINFNDLPAWQKRGVGLYWESIEREGFNPKTQESTWTTRRELQICLKLPHKEDYNQFVQDLIVEPVF